MKIFDLAFDLIVPIVSFIFGLIFDKIIRWWKVIRGRARTRFYDQSYSISNDVVVLDRAIPAFIIDTQSVRDVGEQFFLSVPNDKQFTQYQETLKRKHEAQSFYVGKDIVFGEHSLDWLADQTGVPDLVARIDDARIQVAEKFLTRTRGYYFNSNKIGVRKLNFDRRGDNEISRLDILVYHTDYFTHKVMQHVAHDLTNEGIIDPNILNTKPHYLSEKYFPFLTGLGLNVFILSDNVATLSLCRRSANVGEDSPGNLLHVTMNEGFSASDYDFRTLGSGNITVSNCYRRGMKEELGIDESDARLKDLQVYDLFFSKSLFQVGLFGWAIFDGPAHALDASRAQDRALEIESILHVPFSTKPIQNLLETENFTSYSKVGLESLCRLKGIDIFEGEKFSLEYYKFFLNVAYESLVRKHKVK